MPRLKLNRLPAYSFSHQVEINVSDLNYGGHLANDKLVSLIHQTRVRLLRDLGFSELNLGDDTTGIIMCDLQVVYKAEAFLHDKISIHSQFFELKGGSFRLAHCLLKESQELALVECGFAGYNYQDQKLSILPEIFKEKVKETLA